MIQRYFWDIKIVQDCQIQFDVMLYCQYVKNSHGVEYKRMKNVKIAKKI